MKDPRLLKRKPAIVLSDFPLYLHCLKTLGVLWLKVVVAGGLAGVTATLVTYPLDFIRMRIVVQRLNNDTFRLPKGKTHHDIRMYSDFRNFSYGGLLSFCFG